MSDENNEPVKAAEVSDGSEETINNNKKKTVDDNNDNNDNKSDNENDNNSDTNENIDTARNESENDNNNMNDHNNGSTNFSNHAQIDVEDTNLYVKNLPVEMNDAALYTTFQPYGAVTEHRVMRDLSTKVSLGFGFVRFSRKSEAQQAITALNGYTIGAQPMLVKLAEKQGKVLGRPNDNVYIKQIPLNWDDEHLKALFEPFGTIIQSIILKDLSNNRSRGLGFVRFTSVEAATAAVNALSGYLPNEPNAEKLIVQYAESADEKQRRGSSKRTGQQQQGGPGGMYGGSGGHGGYGNAGHGGHGGYGNQQQQQPYGQMGGDAYGSHGGAGMGMGMPGQFGQPAVGAYGSYNPPTQQGYDQQGGAGGSAGYGRRASGASRYNPYGGNAGNTGAGAGAGAGAYGMGGMGMGGSGAAAAGDDNGNLFIFHLPFEIDEAQLYALFVPFGGLASVKIARDQASGASKGYGFVNFNIAAEAANAIQMMNGYKIGNKYLKVTLKKSQR